MTASLPVMSHEERLRYCVARRKELERVLKDAEILASTLRAYREEADRLIEDIRQQSQIRSVS